MHTLPFQEDDFLSVEVAGRFFGVLCFGAKMDRFYGIAGCFCGEDFMLKAEKSFLVKSCLFFLLVSFGVENLC